MGRRARPPQRTPPRFRPLNERAPGRGFREELPEPGALVPDQTASGPREAHPSLRTPRYGREGCASGRNISTRMGRTGCRIPTSQAGTAAQPRHLPEKLRRLRALPLHLSRAPRRTRQVFPDLLLSVRGRQAHRDLMTLSGFRARRVSSASGTDTGTAPPERVPSCPLLTRRSPDDALLTSLVCGSSRSLRSRKRAARDVDRTCSRRRGAAVATPRSSQFVRLTFCRSPGVAAECSGFVLSGPAEESAVGSGWGLISRAPIASSAISGDSQDE